MPVISGHRRGFTLIEMLIVSAMIVLLAGLAILGAQQLYESTKKKAVQDEVKSIATTLSQCKQDVGFYPKINLLGVPSALVLFRQGTPAQKKAGSVASYYCRPGFDTYGFYGSGLASFGNTLANPVFQVMQFWKPPYMQVSEARAANTTGRRTGIVRMRLSDAEYHSGFPTSVPYNGGDDPSLVWWPTDAYGNPYMVYHISSDPTFGPPQYPQNPKGLRLILAPTEEASYMNVVVSYGPNHNPGGSWPNNGGNGGYPNAALYVPGDLFGTVADYTLKSVTSPNAQCRIDLTMPFMAAIAQSLDNNNPNNPGTFNNGSDDIFFKF